MLELKPNENKTAIQLIFTDFWTQKQEFITAFDLKEAEEIAIELLQQIEQCKTVLHA